MIKTKNKYGQYMTPLIMAQFMVSLAEINEDSLVLEPSCGEGVFISELQRRGVTKIIAYEIDQSLINDRLEIKNESFVTAEIKQKFDLIIGNPPYIRWKNLEPELKVELEKQELWQKYCNSFCDYAVFFIMRAVELLKEGGQLVFITPEYWLNTTHAQGLRNYLLEQGYFEAIYHFNETPIFDKANVSTIVFKFIKSKMLTHQKIKVTKYFSNKKLDSQILDNLKKRIVQKQAEYIDIAQFEKDQPWLLATDEKCLQLKKFESSCCKKNDKGWKLNDFYTLKDFCEIGNGMVSGLDKAFQIEEQDLNEVERGFLLKVIKGKDLKPYVYDKTTSYFLIPEGKIGSEEELRNLCPHFYENLKPYRERLQARYQYQRQIKFWEWVFPRNYKLFNGERPRIFVPSKERISNKDYFRFTLVESGIYPTQDVTAIFPKRGTTESIYYILAFLNSKFVFEWLKFKGIVKGNIVEFSEKPLGSIPYRKIDFANFNEKKSHNMIVSCIEKYIEGRHSLLEMETAVEKEMVKILGFF